MDHVQMAMPKGGEAQARQFYGHVLGMTEIPKPAELAGRGGAWFECGALQLHLGVEADFRPARKAHPALLVRDLDELQARLQAIGAEIDTNIQLEGIKRLFTADPFGNRVELMQRLD
jgi:catechol 2,3-dioxygenase-like lactoylglutathione lyase family enzyme